MLTWRRDAVLAELDAPCLGHPLGRPRGRQHDVHGDVGVALVADAALDVLADGVERRASRVRRRDVDDDRDRRRRRGHRGGCRDPRWSARASPGRGSRRRCVGSRRRTGLTTVHAPGTGAMEVLHLSQHVPKRLGVQSPASPRSASTCSRALPTSRRRGHAGHVCLPLGPERCRIGADAKGIRPRASTASLSKSSSVIRPQRCERGLHASMALVSAVAEAKRPVRRVIAVIRRSPSPPWRRWPRPARPSRS